MYRASAPCEREGELIQKNWFYLKVLIGYLKIIWRYLKVFSLYFKINLRESNLFAPYNYIPWYWNILELTHFLETYPLISGHVQKYQTLFGEIMNILPRCYILTTVAKIVKLHKYFINDKSKGWIKFHSFTVFIANLSLEVRKTRKDKKVTSTFLA